MKPCGHEEHNPECRLCVKWESNPAFREVFEQAPVVLPEPDTLLPESPPITPPAPAEEQGSIFRRHQLLNKQRRVEPCNCGKR